MDIAKARSLRDSMVGEAQRLISGKGTEKKWTLDTIEGYFLDAMNLMLGDYGLTGGADYRWSGDGVTVELFKKFHAPTGRKLINRALIISGDMRKDNLWDFPVKGVDQKFYLDHLEVVKNCVSRYVVGAQIGEEIDVLGEAKYVVLGVKGNYASVIQKPTTKAKADKYVRDFSPMKGEKNVAMTVADAKKKFKGHILGKEYLDEEMNSAGYPTVGPMSDGDTPPQSGSSKKFGNAARQAHKDLLGPSVPVDDIEDGDEEYPEAGPKKKQYGSAPQNKHAQKWGNKPKHIQGRKPKVRVGKVPGSSDYPDTHSMGEDVELSEASTPPQSQTAKRFGNEARKIHQDLLGPTVPVGDAGGDEDYPDTKPGKKKQGTAPQSTSARDWGNKPLPGLRQQLAPVEPNLDGSGGYPGTQPLAEKDVKGLRDELLGEGELVEDFSLSSKDKKVIKAFIDKKSLSGKKLDTDGKKLDGMWMGGRGQAVWSGGKIVLQDQGGKSSDVIHRFIRKNAPKNWIAEDVEDREDTPDPFEIDEGMSKYHVTGTANYQKGKWKGTEQLPFQNVSASSESEAKKKAEVLYRKWIVGKSKIPKEHQKRATLNIDIAKMEDVDVELDEAKKKRYTKFEIVKSNLPSRGPWMAKVYRADGTWETTFGRTKGQVEKDVKALMGFDEDVELDEGKVPVQKMRLRFPSEAVRIWLDDKYPGSAGGDYAYTNLVSPLKKVYRHWNRYMKKIRAGARSDKRYKNALEKAEEADMAFRQLLFAASLGLEGKDQIVKNWVRVNATMHDADRSLYQIKESTDSVRGMHSELLGRNVFGGIIDEISFIEGDEDVELDEGKKKKYTKYSTGELSSLLVKAVKGRDAEAVFAIRDELKRKGIDLDIIQAMIRTRSVSGALRPQTRADYGESLDDELDEGRLGLHLIKNPKGRCSFVGTVPIELGFERKDGKPMTSDEKEKLGDMIHHSVPASAWRKTYKARGFKTPKQALAAARKNGNKVDNADKFKNEDVRSMRDDLLAQV